MNVYTFNFVFIFAIIWFIQTINYILLLFYAGINVSIIAENMHYPRHQCTDMLQSSAIPSQPLWNTKRTHFTVYVLNYVFLWFSLQLSKNHFKHSKTFKYWKYWKIFFNDRYYHHGLLKTTKKSFHCLYLHLSLNIIYKNWG